MSGKARYIVGGALLGIALLVVGLVKFFDNSGGPVTPGGFNPAAARPVTLTGYYGGEKSVLLLDLDIQRILHDRYKISLDAKSRGSIEMVRDTPLTSEDFLWPSSQVAVALYKERGGTMVAAENVFNSPIVLYSWKEVTDALTNVGVVKNEGGAYYIVDFNKLLRLIVEKKRWADIGLPQLSGPVIIRTSDPTLSNSGNLFAGLIANLLNGGVPVDHQTLPKVMPTLRSIFKQLGYKEQKSSDLFQQYLTTGMGAKPIIASYESLLIEYKLQNPEVFRQQLQNRVRILYPRPTLWSSHPIVARTANGKRLIEAFKDPEVQRIAWEKHGFRSGIVGAKNDPAKLGMAGIPNEITNVIEMPEPEVMERIIERLSQKNP